MKSLYKSRADADAILGRVAAVYFQWHVGQTKRFDNRLAQGTAHAGYQDAYGRGHRVRTSQRYGSSGSCSLASRMTSPQSKPTRFSSTLREPVSRMAKHAVPELSRACPTEPGFTMSFPPCF